jgi:hypothetical protein
MQNAELFVHFHGLRSASRENTSMINSHTRAVLVALVMTLPAALPAQRGRVGGGGGGGGGGRGMGMGPSPGMNSIGPIIDMRRELNLTSRQLVRLDSIERTLIDRNDAIRTRLRTRLDSLRPKGSLSGEEEIQWRRTEGDSLRALRRTLVQNDSVARGAAMAVLTDSQRVQVRERIAERRGFMAGSRMGGGRGMRRPPGFDDMMPMGRRGRMGMDGPRGMRGPNQFGPGFYGRRGAGMGTGAPDDVGRPMFRRRGGPPPDSVMTRDW